MITLKDITVHTGGQAFFKGMNWTIEDRQSWAILGPTGAGKTVLAKVLTRRWALTHGDIRYHFHPEVSSEGRPYLHPGEILVFSAETHAAFLEYFARYYQARWQSLEGEDNPTTGDYLLSMRNRSISQTNSSDNETLLLPAKADLWSDLSERTTDLLEALDIRPFLNRQIHLLSNGQSRKAFLAGLLLSKPRVLILDDPYTGLDQTSVAALHSAVDSLLSFGEPQVLLFTSHPEDVPNRTDAILGMKNGQIVFNLVGKDGLHPEIVAELFEDRDLQSRSLKSVMGKTVSLESMANGYAESLRQKAATFPDQLIEMKQVTITYGENRILDQINWQVNQGERWLLSGPNGAGKSTLLSLVMADNPQAYANRITLFGSRRGTGDSIWAIKRAIGYVSPELQAFYTYPSLDQPPLTSLQVAISGFFDSVGLYRKPTTAQKDAALGWLGAFGLTDQANQPFTGLSNGQKRLTLLSRALVKHPPLLVLDEPCQSLDTVHRELFTGMVDALCASTSLTLIYVTHDPGEAPSAITHEIRLEQGVIVKNQPSKRL